MSLLQLLWPLPDSRVQLLLTEQADGGSRDVSIAPVSGRVTSSDAHELAWSVLLGSLDGRRHASRLHAISADSCEDPHIRLRYPVPDHAPCIEVSTFTHCLAGCHRCPKVQSSYSRWRLSR